jgi:hypothetical protein
VLLSGLPEPFPKAISTTTRPASGLCSGWWKLPLAIGLSLALFAGDSRANVIVLTGCAVTPLSAIAAATVGYRPAPQLQSLSLSSAQPEPQGADLAERFPDSECARWMQAGHRREMTANRDDHPVESLKLLRAGTGTYHAYLAPTTVHTGYGCPFDEETWKLSRASTQGMEEPSHFYLKLTFRF